MRGLPVWDCGSRLDAFGADEAPFPFDQSAACKEISRLREAVRARDLRCERLSNNGVCCRYCGATYAAEHAPDCPTVTHPEVPHE